MRLVDSSDRSSTDFVLFGAAFAGFLTAIVGVVANIIFVAVVGFLIIFSAVVGIGTRATDY